MNDWPDASEVARTYDVVAADYAAAFGDELDGKPFDRDLLDRFAAALTGRGPVWDVGCGPAGHVTRYLADCGVEAAGVDLSPGCVSHARGLHADLDFRVGDMLDLPAGDATLSGVLAFYSIIHLRRGDIRKALSEFRRVLVGGGDLLVAMHGGEGEIGVDEWFGHAARARATLVSLAELTGLLADAGFRIRERHERAPYDHEHQSTRLYVWARAA